MCVEVNLQGLYTPSGSLGNDSSRRLAESTFQLRTRLTRKLHMKQLLEFLPIALFFMVYQLDGKTVSFSGWSYQFDGIFSATAVLIAATALQLLLTWLLTRHVDKRLLWTGVAVSVFGGATLLFRNELFIQWKPTVFNWGMALAFTGSQLIGDRNFLERLLGSQVSVPRAVWRRVCWVWIAQFTVVGALNIYVAYNYAEAVWVSYKLYSAIGFTLLLTLATALMMAPWIRQEQGDELEG